MNILITGTTSTIGFYLINLLKKSDNKIYCAVRKKNSNYINQKNIEYIEVDLLNKNNFYKLPNDIDIIIHLAAVNKFSGLTNLEIIEYNTLINNNIIKYSIDANVKKIIYTSSISIYGKIFENEVKENTLINNPDCYGVSKYVGEVGIKSLENNTDSISIRLPAILGNKKNQCFITNLCEKLITNKNIEIYNSNTLFNNVIMNSNIANFIFNLVINNNWKGHHSFPIGSSNPLNLYDLVILLKNRLNSNSQIISHDSFNNSFIINSNYAIDNFNFLPDNTLEICYKHCELFNKNNK